jgi:hypothetical protein
MDKRDNADRRPSPDALLREAQQAMVAYAGKVLIHRFMRKEIWGAMLTWNICVSIFVPYARRSR